MHVSKVVDSCVCDLPELLFEQQIDLLHEQKQSIWLGRERCELILNVEIASTLFGIHYHRPA